MAGDLKLDVMLRAIDKATGPLKKIMKGSGETSEALKANRDQLKQLERAQKDMRGFRQLKEQSRDSARALQQQQDEIRDLSRRMNEAGADTQALGRKRKDAIKQARKLTERYEDEQRKLHDLRSSMTRVEGVTGSYADRQRELQRRIRSTNEQIEQQQHGLREVARRQKAAADAAKKYHRTIGRANNMTGAGMTGLAAGGAGLYAGARVLAPGVEYGETMSRVQALTRLDKEDPRLTALKKQSRDLGASTAFSASDVGRGQAFLAMAGFTPESVGKAIPDMLNLALANGMDLGRTSDISSNLLSSFGLAPDQMGRLADVLTATTTRANVDLEMLGDSMKYVAPQARAMGVSLEQAAAMAGLLGNVGIQGSQAGTTLRAMLTRLAAPTGAAAGALKELGVNAKDTQGDLRDVPRILSDVAKATENMGNADRAMYLKQIFGEEPGAGMAELIAQQGAAGIEKFTEILTQAGGENARVAKIMTDNIGGDLKGLRSAWEEVGISITDTNEGALRDLIQNITAATRAVGDWIKANPELAGTIAKVAAALAVIVAAGGSLLILLSSIVGPIALVNLALGFLAANPVVLTIMAIVAAVALLAGAAYLIYKNWDSIAGWFGDRWEDIKAAFSGGLGSIMTLLLDWNPIGLIYKGIVAGLEMLGIDVPEKFSTLGSAVVDGLIGGITGGLGALWDTITGMGGSIMDWFGEKLGIHSPSRVFAGFGANLLEGLINGIDEKWQMLKDKISNVAGGVMSWFKDKLGIHSPSRVFAQFGGYTIDGFNQGLDRQRDEPARRVAEIAKRLRKAGAGLALGATMSLPAAAMPVEPSVANVPDLPAQRLEIQTSALPDLGELNAPRIQLPKMPTLGALAAPKIETPELPELPALRLEIQKLDLPELPEIGDARSVPIDSRPPLATPERSITVEGDTITLNVYPSEGMDERALAQLVGQMLEERERQKAARTRRNLYDND